MPIYEYQCQACEFEFEKLQKISDPVLVDCPQCHQPSLKKKISAAGFRLSGGGWYETDFKSGNKKNLAGEGGDAKAKDKPADNKAADKKSESAAPKAETKPAAAAKSKE